jgi:hypothetical protein
MRQLPAGRLLISLVAVMTAVTPYLADWNETHIYNPGWPPHAKFHNAQTMLLGTLLGALSLAYLWAPGKPSRDRLVTGAVLAATFWLAQAGSILFPGTGFADPEFAHRLPIFAGVQLNQGILSGVLLGLVLTGYWLDTRRLGRPGAPRDARVAQCR